MRFIKLSSNAFRETSPFTGYWAESKAVYFFHIFTVALLLFLDRQPLLFQRITLSKFHPEIRILSAIFALITRLLH